MIRRRQKGRSGQRVSIAKLLLGYDAVPRVDLRVGEKHRDHLAAREPRRVPPTVRRRFDRRGAPVQLTSMPGAQWAPTWSPEGNWIAFTYQGPPKGVMKARVGGNEAAEMLWPLDTWVDSVAPE